MLVFISPAKTLDFAKARVVKQHSFPQFSKEAGELIEILRTFSPLELMALMNISDKLAALNHQRFKDWDKTYNSALSRQAICTFKGEVYSGLKAETLNDKDFEFAQNHLIILSGLYGMLCPLDYIMPYRLEMGTKLTNASGNTLYDFWKARITESVNLRFKAMANPVLVNLASAEYFKALDITKLKVQIVTPVFKDYSGSEYRVVAIYAKKARGLMTRFIIKNRISDPEQIKTFAVEGYSYNDRLSTANEWVFTRG